MRTTYRERTADQWRDLADWARRKARNLTDSALSAEARARDASTRHEYSRATLCAQANDAEARRFRSIAERYEMNARIADRGVAA